MTITVAFGKEKRNKTTLCVRFLRGNSYSGVHQSREVRAL